MREKVVLSTIERKATRFPSVVGGCETNVGSRATKDRSGKGVGVGGWVVVAGREWTDEKGRPRFLPRPERGDR